MIAFSRTGNLQHRLNGAVVDRISTDLHPAGQSGVDLTLAVKLQENRSLCFMGITKVGPFDIPGDVARAWAKQPNPHGRGNAEVLRPSWNGIDVTRRSRNRWIIDFGIDGTEEQAACYEAPFAHVLAKVRPMRAANNRENYRRLWWLHGEPRPSLRAALARLDRAIATPEVARHRVFAWLPRGVLPDKNLHVVIRDDEVTFGVLQSRLHEVWALRQASYLGVGNDPRYTPSTTFETFPFPEGLTPNIPAAEYAGEPRAQRVAAAARRLNELRENWLNPAELVDRVPEVVPGYPDRVLPKSPEAEKALKKRTLTNLYNERPAWLDHAHRELDEAVAAAYDWEWPLADEEILKRLFELNQERAGEGRSAR